jgi:hypothetical protein
MGALFERLGVRTTVGLTLASAAILTRSRLLRIFLVIVLAGYLVGIYLAEKGQEVPGLAAGRRR